MTDESPSLDARIVDLAPQPTVAIRIQEAMADLDLGALFGEHLPNIADRVADLGGTTAGAPYGRYHQFGPERADLEIGIPVRAPVSALRPLAECEPGELGNSALPGGQAAIAVHRGAYDSLSQAYEALHDWIHGQGRDEGPGPWESYLDDPEEVDDVAQLRTEVVWPVG
jgi:effector-binding domain-containing protein